MLNFVAQHARESAILDERGRLAKAGEASKKVAAANAAKAAAAKLAAQRGNPPPEVPADAKPEGTSTSVVASQAHYESRKRAGAPKEELDAIVAAMMQSAVAGRPV